MGSCYSHKGGGGNYTYTTVQMASTKLEDISRLARPTPYSRGSAKKGIPVSSRHEQSSHLTSNNQQNELKNSKNSSPLSVQSNIPRFNSNVASPHAKNELNENIVPHDNSGHHIMNNNNNNNNSSITNITLNRSPNLSTKFDAGKRRMIGVSLEKRSSKVNSKSCPEQISPSVKTDEKSRLPQRNGSHVARSLLPHFVPRAVSHGSSFPLTSDSQDSITGSDSGIGISLTESQKQEDADTLKDIERLSCNTAECIKEETKVVNLKYPEYKRGLNGKWTLENSSILEFNKRPSGNGKTLECQMKGPLKSISNETFPTYASYKGMMSFKKQLPKSSETIQSRPVETVIPEKILSNNAFIPKKSDNINIVPESKSSMQVTPTSPSTGSKTSSIDSDDKSDGIGSDSKSPSSEIENREFLIDDEIYDQPSLISFTNGRVMDSPTLSLRQSVTELHVLQSLSCKKPRDRLGSDHRDSLLLCSELGSSCSSIASDDLMMDYEKKVDFPDGTVNEGLASPVRKVQDLQQIDEQIADLRKLSIGDSEDKLRKRLQRRLSGPFSGSSGHGKDEWRLRSVSLPLRPPRPMSVSEADDGSIVLDSSSYRLLSQDLTGIKTMLLRLKNVIQDAETINPFDHANTKNIFYQNLVNTDLPTPMKENNQTTPASLSLENADLRRQVVLLQQQLEEKNRTIHLLQQQMTKYINANGIQYKDDEKVNACTQTDRTRSLTGSLTSSLENSAETLVSVQDSIEEQHNDADLKE